MESVTFEQWWTEKYEGKLGSIIIELSFKEVARQAWLAAKAVK